MRQNKRKEVMNRPRVKIKISKIMKKIWKNMTLEERKRRIKNCSVATKRAMNRPEVKIKIHKSIEKFWENSKNRIGHGKILKKTWTLEKKIRQSNILKKAWKRPEIRNKYIEVRNRPEVKAKNSGKNCYLYRDGKSNEPYGKEFSRPLKRMIRKRDNFMCQWPKCGIPENGKGHQVHHIDHNKHHNNQFNLITLCDKHHHKEMLMDLNKAVIMFKNILIERGVLV